MLAVSLFGCGDQQFSSGTSGRGDGDTGGTPGNGDGDGDTGDNGGAGTGGTADPCASCTGDTPLCDTSNECVECLENTDCTDATASHCESGSCVACTENADCSHLSDTPTCETDSGSCVECLPAEDDRESEIDACGNGVCDPGTFSCNDSLTQNTKDICSACVADSECLVGQNCIPLSYRPDGEPEVPLGGFCMKLFPGCSPPYQAGAINRESLSGAMATDYCGLAEEFTTCAAIQDLKDGKPCGSGSECGTGNGEGVCDIVNGGEDPQCSYSCTSTNQCVAGNDCDSALRSHSVP